MSEENNNDPEKTEEEKKQELSNIEKYNAAKRSEAKKASAKKDKAKDEKVDLFLKEAVEARKLNAPPQILEIIKSLDLENQLVVLKANDENRRDDPNRSSLPTPIGKNKDYLWDNYTIYNQTKDKIEWNIPMSELMNRDKNKQLLGIE